MRTGFSANHRVRPHTGPSTAPGIGPERPTRPAVILDPFSGTGTVAGVANVLGRIGIGLDLSFDYNHLAKWRVEESGHFQKSHDRTYGKPKVKRARPRKVGQGELFEAA